MAFLPCVDWKAFQSLSASQSYKSLHTLVYRISVSGRQLVFGEKFKQNWNFWHTSWKFLPFKPTFRNQNARKVQVITWFVRNIHHKKLKLYKSPLTIQEIYHIGRLFGTIKNTTSTKEFSLVTWLILTPFHTFWLI